MFSDVEKLIKYSHIKHENALQNEAKMGPYVDPEMLKVSPKVGPKCQRMFPKVNPKATPQTIKNMKRFVCQRCVVCKHTYAQFAPSNRPTHKQVIHAIAKANSFTTFQK